MVIDYYLRRWLRAGLISDEQYRSIHDFEDKGPPFAIYGFSALGGFTIIVGIVSVIAFNWDQIPGFMKLAAGFLLLFSIGVITLIVQNRRVLFELFLLLYYGLLIGMIGLVAQVFHLSGPLYGALFLWTLPALPLALLSGGSVISHFWAGAFSFAVIDFLDHGIDLYEGDAIFVFLSVGFHAFVWVSILMRVVKVETVETFSRTMIFWSVFTGAMATVFYSAYDPHSIREFIDSFRIYFLIAGILSSGGLVLALIKILKRDLISAIMLSLAMVTVTIFGFVSAAEYEVRVFKAFLFIIAWGLVAIYAARSRKMILFDLAVLGAGVRILVIYFQVFENMAYTGFGLILTGLIILAAVFGWYRIHRIMFHGRGLSS